VKLIIQLYTSIDTIHNNNSNNNNNNNNNNSSLNEILKFGDRSLLNLEFIASVKLQLTSYFIHDTTIPYSLCLKEYFNTHQWPLSLTLTQQQQKWSWYLTYYEIPTPDVIVTIRTAIQQLKNQQQKIERILHSMRMREQTPLNSSLWQSESRMTSLKLSDSAASTSLNSTIERTLSPRSLLLSSLLLDLPIAQQLPISTLSWITEHCFSSD
jgi:hypothetical protein